MRSYFDVARAALERHGGAVEKFIGDAVVGMFGVPEAHEDDALRACRAALEIQEQTRRSRWIPVRIGVNTGEVVAGDAARRETFASGHAVVLGDAVNVAARLEQAAAPGEILIGDATYRLVRDAVRVEEVAPIDGEGQVRAADRVPAARCERARAASSPDGTPLVGRDRRARAASRPSSRTSAQGCRLVTVVGEAGVGKSRLTAELAARVGDAPGSSAAPASRTARASPTGRSRRSSTSWPGSATTTPPPRRARACPARIAQLLGLAEGTTTARARPPRRSERSSPQPPPSSRWSCCSTTSSGPSPRCSTCSSGCRH